MFNKGKEPDFSRASSPPRIGESQPIRPENVSVIGPTMTFKGELSADEDLIIEGSIEGTIAHHKKNLTIGSKGRVAADIHASSVIVEGQLSGDIHSDGLVSLAKGCIVRGNIYCARIVMQDGADFSGVIDMGKKTVPQVAKTRDITEVSRTEPKNQTA